MLSGDPKAVPGACNGPGPTCSVCTDAGEVGDVLAQGCDAMGRGLVRFAGGREELVALDLVVASPGDRVLVHLGFALAVVAADSPASGGER